MTNIKNYFNKIKAKLRPRLVWKLRKKIFLQRIRKGLALLEASIWIFLLALLVWVFNKIIPFIGYLKDPSIATLIGAVIGALVGGLFAYIAAVNTQKEKTELEVVIKRRDGLYQPLYNELLAIKNEFNYSTFDIHSPNFNFRELNLHLPKFWETQESKVKIVQIPVDLVEAMTSIKDEINNCKNKQQIIMSSKNFRKLKDERGRIMQFSEVTEENYRKSEIKLKKNSKKINSLRDMDLYILSLVSLHTKLDDVIEYLEELIVFINKKYEPSENWY